MSQHLDGGVLAVLLHASLVDAACASAERALASALATGRRTDCLRLAVECLRGARRNVAYEDYGTDDGTRATAPDPTFPSRDDAR